MYPLDPPLTIWVSHSIKACTMMCMYSGHQSRTTARVVFDFFNALGTVAMVYSGQSIVMEIEVSLPSKTERPSNKANMSVTIHLMLETIRFKNLWNL